mgnify:CR=1 FL=1
MKILVVSTSGFEKREGISTIIYDYFSRFDKELFNIHFLVSGKYSEELLGNYKNAGLVDKHIASRKKELFKYIIELIRLFKREKYDAVYVHGSSAIMSLELAIAKKCGCKIRAVHSHNTKCNHIILDKCLRPFFYSLYTDAFACGEDAGKWLFGNRRFFIVKNGRDIAKYSYNDNKRRTIRNKLGLEEDCLVIGQVGRLNYQKNPEFTINVFWELNKIKPSSKLFIIGDGYRLDELKNLVTTLNLEDSIVFTESIDNVDEYLQAMDVMILPSRHEGLPLVVVEWQIANLPSLISDCITSECKFSDLVHYMSLDRSYGEWARELIQLSDYDRRNNNDFIRELTIQEGYDISENVMNLQRKFVEAVNRN